jgi:hypothetical protein
MEQLIESETTSLELSRLHEEFPELEGATEFVIRARYNDQLPVTARPCFDKSGRIFTGQGPTGHYETLSEEEKRNMNYVVTPDTSVVLTDGKVFYLTNPIDVINWRWLRRHPYIAFTKEQMFTSRDASFYVFNHIIEAERRVRSSKERDKARYLIQYELNRDQLINAAKILGNAGAETMNDTQLQDFLLQLTETQEKLVLNAINPTNKAYAKAKILLNDLIRYRIVQRGDGSLFRFGGEKGAPLGHTEDTVIDFMLDDKNQDTVLMMKTALVEKKQTSVE